MRINYRLALSLRDCLRAWLRSIALRKRRGLRGKGNPLQRYVSGVEMLERLEMPNVLLNPVSGVGATLTDLPFDSTTADSSSAPAMV
jgi:hypothetical protein